MNIDKPNILFIMTDQQHAGMMSCTGDGWISTPAMDSLAQNGTRFTRAYCANPVCTPSRISMATGMMPNRLGAPDNGTGMSIDALPDEIVQGSMGLAMKSAGYETFYGGKVHMCSPLAPKNTGYDAIVKDERGELPGACVEFIQKKRAKPFFAVASFINPHDICFAHSAKIKRDIHFMDSVNALYKQAVKLNEDQLPPLPMNHDIPQDEPQGVVGSSNRKAITPAPIMREEYSERDWRIYRWIYRRLTEVVDSHIAQILKGLGDAGLEKNTLVIFTSDHGNMDGAHRLSSKGFFYEESVGVPYIMSYPGAITEGKVNDTHLVSTGLDILPTLCDYAGIDIPGHLPGLSLRSVAEGGAGDARREYVAAENSARMICGWRYKYWVYPPGKNRTARREALFDLEKDPGEMVNLAGSEGHTAILNEYRGYFNEWANATSDDKKKEFEIF